MGGLLIVAEPPQSKSSGFDLTTLTQEVGKFTRKINSLSKAVDYLSTELLPQVVGETKVDEVYRNTKKGLDYFMRHLI